MNQVFSILQVAVGLGLVVFVHELGHFLAARWCGVRVKVFSLGYGPPLLSIQRGETRYQIAAVPLGGFVAMAGEFSAERKGPPDPGDLLSKSVGQRFFVYSAGVIMNLVFALVVLPALFWVGVPFRMPVVAAPDPGSAAWYAGIREGDEIVEVDGRKVFDFGQIALGAILADRGPFEVKFERPGEDGVHTVVVDPEPGPEGFRTLGVDPGDPHGRMYVEEGGPADLAGLRDSDRLLGVVGGDAHLSARRQLAQALDERPATLRLRVAGEDGSERTVDVPLEWKPDGPKLIGVAPLSNFVLGVRGGGPLADAVPEGARLAEVRGRRVTNGVEFLAAVRDGEPGAPTTLVLRDGSSVDLTDAFERHLASRASPTEGALDVALGADTTTTITAPSEDGGAFAAGVVAGDRIAAIDGKDVANWSELIERAQAAIARGGTVDVTVERDGALITYGVEPRALTTAVTGFAVDGPGTPNFVYRTQNPLEAFTVGLASAKEMLEQVWISLRKIVTAEISSRNIGGVISMGAIGYHTAKQGPSKLFYFLCLLSINLAVLNVLPIPVLDGGHLLFLIVEKLKGGPVSERVLGYSQLVGFVMIVSLLVYATWNDLQRWVLG